jgi:medium-chain acyl-[acyl-carrier-protein] hydrolase
MELFLPILRADFAVAETSRTADEPPLACPITALGGVDDPRARPEELDAWRIHTAAFERVTFAGGHFFLQSGRSELLTWMSSRLTQITAAL